MKADRIVFGVALLAVGVIWFLVNLGIIQSITARELWRYWPLLLVLWGLLLMLGKGNGSFGCLIPILVILLVFGGVFGVFLPMQRSVPEDSFSSFEIGAEEGTNVLRLDLIQHAGEFFLGSQSGTNVLEANIHGNQPVLRKESSIGVAEIFMQEPSGTWPFHNRISRWEIHLSEQLPMEVEYKVGAVQAEFDLAGLQITDLHIKMGAGDLTLRLGGTDTQITVDGGAGSITIFVPDETGVKLRASGGLLSVQGDRADVLSVGDRRYESRDIDEKTAVAEIHITAGAGSVELKRIQ
jgi:hypothetical protein